MPVTTTKTRKRSRVLIAVAALCLPALALNALLQGPFAHRLEPFVPQYGQIDLTSILAREELDRSDYETLYAQTGLGPAAVDDLLALGEAGKGQIVDTQAAFFDPPGTETCRFLGVTTREHRRIDESGNYVFTAPLAPLKEGDVILSLSTHTVGWTHGHAGLVVDPDPERPVTLESVVLGSRSSTMNANHWRTYTTMMVLRPKADDEARRRAVEIALDKLVDIPYSLVSGVFGDKFQPLDGPHDAQCGYLPWYAWMAVGVDLDGDGGYIVTPADLAMSPNVEVVQVYGIDPARFPLPLTD